MNIFAFGKKLSSHCLKDTSLPEGVCKPTACQPVSGNAGNVFFALFAAVAMVGAVGFAFNTVMRGPISGMTEVTRKTVAENTVISASRLAIVGATTQQTSNGDCDADGMVEPMPFRDAGTLAKPAGGGYLPTGLLPDTLDPWKTEYGYCAWDSGSVRTLCGGAAGRLVGSPTGNQYALVIISAGKDRVFQTSCAAYVDTTPADGKPDSPLVNKPAGSDDTVLGYTYAEANNLGNGMWKAVGTTTAATSNDLEIKGGGKFSDKVVLTGDTLTGGGLVLPNQTTSGDCDATHTANNKQLRRNTSTIPPTIEVCDIIHDLGWTPVSGAGGGGVMTGEMVSRWKLDEMNGTVAADSEGGNPGTLINTPVWLPSGGVLNGAINVVKTGSKYVEVPRSESLEPKTVSIALWVKRHGTQAASSYILNKGGSVNSYAIATNASQTIDFITGSDTLSAAFVIPDEAWVQIVGVYEPSGTTLQKKLYINGTLQNSKTLTTTIVYDTSGKLFFGSKAATGTDRFTGDLDDIRFYNKALSPEEISALYNNTQPAVLNLEAPARVGTVYGWGDDANNQLGNGPATTALGNPGPATNGTGFVQVSSRDSFACGLKSNGTVWCWGDDTYGQNGNGLSYGSTDVPTYPVQNLDNVVKVAAGGNHACALQKSGTVWCWGWNSNGQLGNSGGTAPSPVIIASITDFIDISAGGMSTCGVRKNGEAWCWGAGTSGQLGNGASSDSSTPVLVSNVTDFIQIEVGSGNTCGVSKTGKAWCWGLGTSGQLGNNASATQNTPQQVSTYTDFKSVTTASLSSCGLRANGAAYCWGSDTNGVLGNGATTGNQQAPSAVTTISDFTKITMGVNQACGIRKNGEVWCWGNGVAGQMGDNGSGAAQVSPVRSGIANAFDIASGISTVLVLVDTANTDYTVAGNARGKLGTGENMSCFIRQDGTAWCAGFSMHGMAGTGEFIATGDGKILSFSKVTDSGPWTQIAVGGQQTCGIKSDGTAWCWGYDGDGEVGESGNTDWRYNVPQPVYIAPGTVSTWSSIQTGNAYTCGIKTDGTAWCWGLGGSGQLGNASTGNAGLPSAVSGGGTWSRIATGITHTCGIKSDGTAWCWGSNSNGQLGNANATTGDQSTPVKVSDPGPWSAIAAGGAFTCGIKTNGTAWCWGDDTKGQLGNRATITGNRNVPYKVFSPEKWTTISISPSAEATHACGITVDGSGWCWGGGVQGPNNASSNLRLGTNDSSQNNVEVPVKILGGGQYIALGAGMQHSCGIKTDSSLWCWGTNWWGQLGDGTMNNQTVPTASLNGIKQNPWKWNDAGTGISPISGLNLFVGTTRWMSDTGAASRGLNLGATGTATLLSNGTDANQLLLEASGTRNSSQLSLKTSSGTSTRSIGIDYMTGNLEFARNSAGTAMVSTLSPDLEITATGDVGIGTTGNPATKLDVNGPVRIGNEACGSTKSGMLRFTGTATWEYCDSSGSAQTFGRFTGSTTSGSPYWSVGKKTLSASPNGTFGIKGDGSAYSWGDGLNGVFADGNTSSHTVSTAVAVPTYTDWIVFDGSLTHTCGIRVNGTLWCWGDDTNGQLGNGTGQGSKTVPYQVGSGTNWIDVSTGDGSGHTCGIRSDGKAYCWGQATKGRLGNGQSTGTYHDPVQVPDQNGSTGWTDWKSISAGYIQTCGIRGIGEAWCWGGGPTGAGDTYWNDVDKPKQVQTNYTDWRMISAGWQLTCGVRTTGQAYCWGPATKGQTGDGQSTTATTSATLVTGGYTDWNFISAGSGHDTASTPANPGHACGLRGNGSAWCWGSNEYGQLGNNATTTSPVTAPVRVCDDSASCTGYWNDWVSIAAGDYHTCGMRSDSTVWCWGKGGSGQLGNGTSDSSKPKKVN